MDRRRFNSICTGLLSGSAVAAAHGADLTTPYPTSQLVFADETPVIADSLPIGEAFIFHYPYQTTPCFLVRLDQTASKESDWPGGVGRDQSVVAFSAICSHKMSHPAKPISHIAYRHEPIQFHTADGTEKTQGAVISCCSERSVYDTRRAGRVLAGPAPAPLASILLETDAQQHLFATGSIGQNQYEQFLDTFGFRLALEYGITDVRQRSTATTSVIPADTFSKQQILC